MKKAIIAGSCCLVVSAIVAVAAEASLVSGGNTQVQIGFEKPKGGQAQFVDVRSGHDFIETNAAGRSFWQLELDNGKSLTFANAGHFATRALPGDESGVELTWNQFASAPDLSVVVEIRIDEQSPMTRWKIRTEGAVSGRLRQVKFPILPAISRQPGETLVVPDWVGQELSEPRTKLAAMGAKGGRFDWMYPGHLSMQFMALARPAGVGLYLACDDQQSWPKQFSCVGSTNEILGWELVHYLEVAGSGVKSWRLPYNVLLGAFQGDWYRAASIYRSWATNQPSAQASRLRNGRVPAWVTDTSAWVWNRGRSGTVLPGALALQKELSQPVSVLWHWWHGCAYDTGFPEYLPPREGTEPFKAAVADARKNGVRALVYMNQRLWGKRTESWRKENAERYAVKGPDGKIREEVYNTFTKAPCISMCMGTDFWRKKYAGIAEPAICDLGVGGIYMDQACASLACFDPKHGHFVGRGRFWLGGFETLAADIRKRAADCRPGTDPIALAGEGCGESWLPSLDLMLGLQVSRERYSTADGWETVPLFQTVYHEYAVIFGNYSSLTMPPYDDLWPKETAPAEPLKLLDRKYDRQFYLEQARAFVWGQQPTIANLLPSHFSERAEEVGFFARLARVRMRALPYLLYGSSLQAPTLGVPDEESDFSRLSIYAGQGKQISSYRKSADVALGSAWRSPDGKTALAIANITDAPMNIPLPLENPQYEIPERARVYRIDDKGREMIGTLAKGQKRYTVVLPPRSGWVVEFLAE